MTKSASSTRRLKGAAGEARAAEYLSRGGWSVLERNFRTRTGEIDIIAARGDEVVFVEVKTWGALPAGELEHSIDRRKQQRIARTARFFLAGRPDLSERRLRFDVVFLGSDPAEIRHIENAFGGGIDSWYG
jgi:putative endonuclease